MPDLADAKESGLRALGAIPQDWCITRVHDLFYEVSERYEKVIDGYLPLLSVSEYYGVAERSDKIDDDAVLVRAETLEGYKKCQQGDLVSNIMLTWKSALGCSPLDGIVSPSYCVYRPRQGVNCRYYHYLFRTSTYGDVFRVNSTGLIDSRLRLYSPKFLVIQVPKPPDEEQSRIVAYLDSACANLDATIAEAKASIEEYKLLKQSVITQAVTKGLDPTVPMKDSGVEWIGRIPEHWEAKQARMVFRQTNTRGNSTLTLLAATQKNGMRPQSEIEGVVHVKEETDLQTFKTVHRDNFVISLRSFQGGFEHSDYEGVCSPAYQTFHAIAQIGTAYFKFFFKSPNFVDAMNALTVGIREGRNIRYADFAKSPLLMPPLGEQGRIAAYLGEKCDRIDSLVAEKQATISDLESYKKSLIYEVVTGKRRVA